MLRKRDAENRMVLNNVLMNGHYELLEYLLDSHVDALRDTPYTLEGKTTLLHQLFAAGMFI